MKSGAECSNRIFPFHCISSDVGPVVPPEHSVHSTT
jgi:hypothetical protein